MNLIQRPSSRRKNAVPADALREKARYIEDEGVILVVLEFDGVLSTAEAFVSNVLLNGFGARHVVSGDDFVLARRCGTIR